MISNQKDSHGDEIATPSDKAIVSSARKGRQPGSSKRSRLTPDQQVLAQNYLPMARALAKPLKRCWPSEKEEFESAALLALVEAAQSFDSSRNVKFATFARYRIWGALRDVQRSLITAGWKCDLENAPKINGLAHDSEDHGRILMTEPDRPIGQVYEGDEFVEGCLRNMPPKHARACREIYLNGKTQGEAAKLVGCSKSRLSYLHKEGLEMIKDHWKYLTKHQPNAAVPTRA